jgi:hypothetical protein
LLLLDLQISSALAYFDVLNASLYNSSIFTVQQVSR